jgi:hypothetical protein
MIISAYLDTSDFGGYFDIEEELSNRKDLLLRIRMLKNNPARL